MTDLLVQMIYFPKIIYLSDVIKTIDTTIRLLHDQILLE